MIEFLLLDLDDTILDFHKAERFALSKTIREFGVEPSEAVLDRYHQQMALGTAGAGGYDPGSGAGGAVCPAV